VGRTVSVGCCQFGPGLPRGGSGAAAGCAELYQEANGSGWPDGRPWAAGGSMCVAAGDTSVRVASMGAVQPAACGVSPAGAAGESSNSVPQLPQKRVFPFRGCPQLAQKPITARPFRSGDPPDLRLRLPSETVRM
jgi:hypothetical protein